MSRFPTRPLKRRCWVGISGVLAVVVGVAGGVWACVPQPKLVFLQPRSSGPSGIQVTVGAVGLDPGRAEIRWNAPDGPLLATATGPSFSVPVTVPQAPEGLYSVIVLGRDPGGGIGNTGMASFQVTADGRSTGDGSMFGDATRPAATPRPAPGPRGLFTNGNFVLGVVVGAALLAVGGLGGAALVRRSRNGHLHAER